MGGNPERSGAGSELRGMDRRDGIEVGDRYRDAAPTVFGGASRTVWVVAAVWEAPDGLAHVQIVGEADRHRAKTVSASALLDRRLYVAAGDG
ncbi:MAG: hypothetical protein HYS77_13545 [Candidatus Rokubacteria bacterium]|nr:hypothetical protein [Candidatus Rokubacteria bacterium]